MPRICELRSWREGDVYGTCCFLVQWFLNVVLGNLIPVCLLLTFQSLVLTRTLAFDQCPSPTQLFLSNQEIYQSVAVHWRYLSCCCLLFCDRWHDKLICNLPLAKGNFATSAEMGMSINVVFFSECISQTVQCISCKEWTVLMCLGLSCAYLLGRIAPVNLVETCDSVVPLLSC